MPRRGFGFGQGIKKGLGDGGLPPVQNLYIQNPGPERTNNLFLRPDGSSLYVRP